MRGLRLYLVLTVFLLPASNAVASDAENGARLYKRCAACHLPTGAGVPGAFPPINDGRLDVFYETDAGRSYLVLVLAKGLSGPIKVDGITYRGVMPAQYGVLRDQGIADVLNYLLAAFQSGGNARQQFTDVEVKDILATYGKAKARDLSRQRPSLWTAEGGAE